MFLIIKSQHNQHNLTFQFILSFSNMKYNISNEPDFTSWVTFALHPSFLLCLSHSAHLLSVLFPKSYLVHLSFSSIIFNNEPPEISFFPSCLLTTCVHIQRDWRDDFFHTHLSNTQLFWIKEAKFFYLCFLLLLFSYNILLTASPISSSAFFLVWFFSLFLPTQLIFSSNSVSNSTQVSHLTVNLLWGNLRVTSLSYVA